MMGFRYDMYLIKPLRVQGTKRQRVTASGIQHESRNTTDNYPTFVARSRSELQTTLTDESGIAAAASTDGCPTKRQTNSSCEGAPSR